MVTTITKKKVNHVAMVKKETILIKIGMIVTGMTVTGLMMIKKTVASRRRRVDTTIT